MSLCHCSDSIEKMAKQRQLLLILLSLNAAMFVVEGGFGLVADSAGLLADSLDMLADATVYGIALYAVGRAAYFKARAALLSGFCQLLLALVLIGDIYRRAFWDSEPIGALMIATALMAAVVNLICVILLSQHRDGGIHLKASYLFSVSDLLVNLSVVASGVLVSWLGASWPDLLIGLLIACVVASTGLRIVRESWSGVFLQRQN